MDPRGMVCRIYKHTIHCYTQNMEILGLVVSKQKIFLCLFHCKSILELIPPREEPFLTPGAWLAGFM